MSSCAVFAGPLIGQLRRRLALKLVRSVLICTGVGKYRVHLRLVCSMFLAMCVLSWVFGLVRSSVWKQDFLPTLLGPLIVYIDYLTVVCKYRPVSSMFLALCVFSSVLVLYGSLVCVKTWLSAHAVGTSDWSTGGFIEFSTLPNKCSCWR